MHYKVHRIWNDWIIESFIITKYAYLKGFFGINLSDTITATLSSSCLVYGWHIFPILLHSPSMNLYI